MDPMSWIVMFSSHSMATTGKRKLRKSYTDY